MGENGSAKHLHRTRRFMHSSDFSLSLMIPGAITQDVFSLSPVYCGAHSAFAIEPFSPQRTTSDPKIAQDLGVFSQQQGVNDHHSPITDL